MTTSLSVYAILSRAVGNLGTGMPNALRHGCDVRSARLYRASHKEKTEQNETVGNSRCSRSAAREFRARIRPITSIQKGCHGE